MVNGRWRVGLGGAVIEFEDGWISVLEPCEELTEDEIRKIDTIHRGSIDCYDENNKIIAQIGVVDDLMYYWEENKPVIWMPK